MKKIIIATPSNDFVHADYCFSMVTMVVYSLMKQMPIVAITNEKSCLVQKSRCNIVETARKNQADAILFIDSDMLIPRETLCVLDQADRDIIGCNCATRRIPNRSTAVDLQGKPILKETGITEVLKIGTGVLYVKMKVFDALEKPYFDFTYDKDQGFVGEDYYFCDKARKAGFKIYCEHDLSDKVFHLSQVPVTIQDIKQ